MRGMYPADQALWERLQAFRFNESTDVFPFARRLARENNWSADFTTRVIEEYRRFLYLAVRAGHAATPSDTIDQAWHLHLIYTESYWEDLCGSVLQRKLHHGPTRGGKREDDRYFDQYSATLSSYEQHFGEKPPADIWPAPQEHFNGQKRWRRVDTAAVWLLPKITLKRALAAWIIGVASSLSLIACVAQKPLAAGLSSDLLYLLIPIGTLLALVYVVYRIFAWIRGLFTSRPSNSTQAGAAPMVSSCGSTGCGGGDSAITSAADDSSDCAGDSSSSDGGSSSGCGSSGCGSGCGGGGD